MKWNFLSSYNPMIILMIGTGSLIFSQNSHAYTDKGELTDFRGSNADILVLKSGSTGKTYMTPRPSHLTTIKLGETFKFDVDKNDQARNIEVEKMDRP